jgi:tripartite-type tricarboxylate transporter receptor subunit TctC
MTFRLTRRGLAAATAAAALPLPAIAQGWPSRPIRWILPWAPGGGSDVLARAVAAAISGPLGQPLLLDNRRGGATVIATKARRPLGA